MSKFDLSLLSVRKSEVYVVSSTYMSSNFCVGGGLNQTIEWHMIFHLEIRDVVSIYKHTRIFIYTHV